MPEMMTNGSTWDDQMKILMRAEKAEAAVEALRKALERARPYVDYAVRHDGGIDHCDIAYRVDLEAIDAALSLSRSDI